MPVGMLVTLPLPDVLTLNTAVVAALAVYETVTAVAPLSVTAHVPVPLHAPPQPANVEPAAAAAFSVTNVPEGKLALLDVQAAAQLSPAGVLVTLPLPVPDLVSVRGKVVTVAVNVGVTLVPVVRSTVQVEPTTVVQPDQPAKVEPAAAAAVSVTEVPDT